MASKRNGDGDLAVAGAAEFYTPKKHWASRLAPYASEWAGFLATMPVAAGAHWWMTSEPAAMPWASAGLTLLGTGVTALTWYCARARAVIVRRFATATAGITAAWTTAATIAGPWETPLLQLYAFGGAGVALSWSIFKALKRGGDFEAGGDNLWEKVKLAGVKTGPLEVEPNKVSGTLQLPRGELDVGDVQKRADKIASYLGLRKGAVRIIEDPEDASQAQMTVVPRDVLKDPADWPGASHPGGSIADPLVFGVYEDTELLRLWLPGDPKTSRNATHLQINGMNGSGKSAGFKQLATEILTRRDVALIVLDPSKGDQTVGFLQGSRAHLVTDVGACKKLLKALPGVITNRASQLGRWGYDQWVPEAFTKHRMPYLVVWVEEATKLLKSVEKFDVIAQEARSAGISLVLSQQKSTFRQMSTDVRSQLGAVLCFGVKDPEDAGYSLSDETLDAGAAPHRWKNRWPGCCYLEAPGVEEARYPTPARTYRATDEALAADIAACAEHAPDLPEDTAEALGLPQRASDTADDQEGGTVVPMRSTTPTRHTDPDVDPLEALDSLQEADVDDDPDDPEAGLASLPDETETDLDEVDPDAEIPEVPDTAAQIALPQPRPSLARARANVENWATRQPGVFGPKDVPTDLHGRDRSWVSRMLSALAEEGVIVRADDPGTYRARPARGHAA
ncbi:plasmid transfer protein TraB [Saccharopolyspora rosea]|uniref:FtsK domain-containing protein n=1 Tax=Saccharopolyspora rosea TaxID=524884 RepID=A0ABW3FPA3_9PSEU